MGCGVVGAQDFIHAARDNLAIPDDDRAERAASLFHIRERKFYGFTKETVAVAHDVPFGCVRGDSVYDLAARRGR
jgi:hypothetical protein